MAPSEQADRSDAEELPRWDPDPRQLDMFGGAPESSHGSAAADVRAELTGIIAKARAAPGLPWPPTEVSHWRAAFAQVADELPAEEAAQLRLEFAAELSRLKA
jgi:hypothetical protein